MQKKPKIAPEVPTAPFPEQVPIVDPEEPLVPKEDPDFIPEEDPFESPPIEIPPPGEGP